MADLKVGRIFSALSVGSQITTVIGLVGFAVACIFAYNAYRLHQETVRLESLPEESRARQLDEYLTRYELSGKDFSAAQKFQLIQREMDQRFWIRIIYVLVGGGFFLAALVVVHRARKGEKGGVRNFSPAEEQVCEYQQDILNLRGDFEALELNPESPAHIRKEGKRLAELLGGIDDDLLDAARQIVKYEYHGWALAMVARVYDLEKEKEKRVEYSERAIASFRRALELMEEAKGQRWSDAESKAVYEWVTSNSEDQNRTRYLLALTLAVNAQAGGTATREQVKAEFDRISSYYRTAHPPERYEPFRWAGIQKETPSAAEQGLLQGKAEPEHGTDVSSHHDERLAEVAFGPEAEAPRTSDLGDVTGGSRGV